MEGRTRSQELKTTMADNLGNGTDLLRWVDAQRMEHFDNPRDGSY